MTAPNCITPTTTILDDAGRDWAWAYVVFRPVGSVPGYLAGSDGTVWSPDRKGGYLRRKPSIHRTGHLYVNCRPDGPKVRSFFVHRLVLEAFAGPCPEGMECCHRDGIRTNNRLDNLRWDTRLANRRDSIRHGTQVRGERQGSSKLTAEQVVEMIALDDSGVARNEIARRFGVSKSTASLVLLGRIWQHIERPNLARRIRKQSVRPQGSA